MKLLAISGSLRAASTNTLIIGALAGAAPAGITVDTFAGLGSLPIFNPDVQAIALPPEVAELDRALAAADGLVVASPEYAHGVPGGLKNALDWLVGGETPVGKPVMLVHASPRSQLSRASLRDTLRTMSFAVHDEDELELSLLGKAGAEADAILEAARPSLRAALERFARFIRLQAER